MIRKKYKMALSSLVLSSLTLIVLTVSFLIPNTDFGKKLFFPKASELQSDLEKSYLEIDKLINEKEFLMHELKLQLEKVQLLKAENDSLQLELDVKYQQIEALIQKIDSLEEDVSKLMTLRSELAYAKKQYQMATTLSSETKETVSEKATVVNDENPQVTSSTPSKLTTVVNSDSPVKDIIRNNEENIRLLNSSIQTYHKRDSGTKKETSTASKVNHLVLHFTLYVDKSNKKKTANFYIQLFDTNNKNVGKTKKLLIDDKELVYSFESSVEYTEQVNQVAQEFSTEGLNLDKGVYFLNIFSAKGKLLCSRSFELN